MTFLKEHMRNKNPLTLVKSHLGGFKRKLARLRDSFYWDNDWIFANADPPLSSPDWLGLLQALIAQAPLPLEGELRSYHLVLVTGSLVPGGAERQWCYLARELAQRGYTVTLMSAAPLHGENGHYLPLLEGSGVRIVERDSILVSSDFACFSISQVPYEIWMLAAALDYLRPTHVLAQLDHCNVWCGAAAFVQKYPAHNVLMSFRSLNPSRSMIINQPYYRDYYRILYTNPKILLNANTSIGAKDYEEWLHITEKRIAVTHNAVQLPTLSPNTRYEARAALGIPDNAPVVLGVFRLTPQKNPNLFLEVARAVHKEIPDAIFLHAGVGLHGEDLQRASEDPETGNWFRMLGRRDDVARLMRAADILLLCSEIEGLPNVLLEAQAAELPIVATKVGGVPDAVQEGKTALLSQAGDRVDLARSCIELLRDPERRRRMGRSGRKFVEANFTFKALGDAFLQQLGLPEQAPECSGFRQSRSTDEVPLSVRYQQCLLEELFQQCPGVLEAPLLVFASWSLSRKAASLLPPHSLCLTLPGVAQPDGIPAMTLDWRKPHSYARLKGKVWPGSCALILGDWPLWENMEGRLWACGVRWLVVLWCSKWYRFPLRGGKIWHELHGFLRKVRRRIKNFI